VKPAGISGITRGNICKKNNDLATNTKNKNIRDLYRRINDFKRGYQPRSNLVNDENDRLLADSHNILNRWKNYFSQLLNVRRARDIILFFNGSSANSEPRPLIRFRNDFSQTAGLLGRVISSLQDLYLNTG
jgi:hypothetical protein